MYTGAIPTHDIDLRRSEHDRWLEVIRAERAQARRLLGSMLRECPPAARTLAVAGGWLFRQMYAFWGGRYLAEIDSWAEGCDVRAGDLLLLNCSYELSHLSDCLPRVGCTAGVRWVDGVGYVHVRSMDWPVPQIGPATRLFRFHDGRREFVAVGVLGHVGVLSGMVPRAYSITLNWAPPVGIPRFDWGPAFLLREVLETCGTYAEAVEALAQAELATSVFYLVCGVRMGDACVVERTRDAAAVRRIERHVLVQANHHVSRKFRAFNEPIAFETEEEYSLLETSQERADELECALLGLGRDAGIDDVAACLDIDPVCNDDSHQQMAFCPRTGDVRAWRRVRGKGGR